MYKSEICNHVMNEDHDKKFKHICMNISNISIYNYPCILYAAQVNGLKGQDYQPYFHIQQRQVVIIFPLF